MRRSLARARAALVLGAAVAGLTLLVATSRPSGTGTDPDRVIVAAATWCAWLVCFYLLLCVAGCAVTALVGRRAGTVRGVPGWVCRCCDVMLGAALAVSTMAPQAFADGPAAGRHQDPTPRPAAPSLAWPVGPVERSTATRPLQPVRRPVVAAAPRKVRSRRHDRGAVVVVAPGDTLWSIAADALPPSAPVGQIAASWPTWWSVNRAVVGPDPDLIHPGQRLVRPGP